MYNNNNKYMYIYIYICICMRIPHLRSRIPACPPPAHERGDACWRRDAYQKFAHREVLTGGHVGAVRVGKGRLVRVCVPVERLVNHRALRLTLGLRTFREKQGERVSYVRHRGIVCMDAQWCACVVVCMRDGVHAWWEVMHARRELMRARRP